MSRDIDTTGIWAIIVTYNRLELLKECVNALRNQTRLVDNILVVNNNSSDGTNEWLDMQFDLKVLQQKNLGGAGGFHNGIKYAYEKNAKYFWLMDDDAICAPDAMEKLLIAKKFLQEKGIRYGFLHNFVTDDNGEQQIFDGFTRFWGKYIDNQLIQCNTATFVGFFVARATVCSLGLPYLEFFISGDDIEYSQRISEKFNSFIVLNSRILHKVKVKRPNGMRVTEENLFKTKYGQRNTLFCLRKKKKYVRCLLMIVYYPFLGLLRKESLKVILTMTWARIIGTFLFNPKVVYIEKESDKL